MPSNLLCDDTVLTLTVGNAATGGTSVLTTSCADPLFVQPCEVTYRMTDTICVDNAGVACEVDRIIVRNTADNSLVSATYADMVTGAVIPIGDITIDPCESTIGVPNPLDNTIMTEHTVCAIVGGAPAEAILQIIIRDEDTYIHIDTLYENIQTNTRIAASVVQLVDAADCCP